MTATSACGVVFGLAGKLQCTLSYNNKLFTTLCYSTKSDITLLGADWLDDLGLRNQPIDTFCKRGQTSQHYTDTLVKLSLSVLEEDIGR